MTIGHSIRIFSFESEWLSHSKRYFGSKILDTRLKTEALFFSTSILYYQWCWYDSAVTWKARTLLACFTEVLKLTIWAYEWHMPTPPSHQRVAWELREVEYEMLNQLSQEIERQGRIDGSYKSKGILSREDHSTKHSTLQRIVSSTSTSNINRQPTRCFPDTLPSLWLFPLAQS